MEINEAIKLYRKKNNLTQKQLGLIIDKNESTIRKYENGQIKPPLSVLKKIDLFNIHILDENSNMDHSFLFRLYLDSLNIIIDSKDIDTIESFIIEFLKFKSNK